MPAPPFSLLAAELPINVLFSVLPVPLMAAVPVSVRFSTLAPSVQVIVESTRSVPSAAVGDGIGGVVYYIDVVAAATDHRVRSGPTVESVAAEFPVRTLAALLPVSTLLSVLPVPLTAVVPVSVRFSTFAESVVATEESTHRYRRSLLP